MGSKQKLLPFIWDSICRLNLKFTTVLDAFSGSGCVSYLFKTKGKEVTSNDFLKFCYHIANATIENNREILDDGDVEFLLSKNARKNKFIERTFKGLYYTDEENQFLDNISANIKLIKNPYKQSVAIASICRACMKKRPRGIFTYTGIGKYDDGRRDLRISLEEQFKEAVNAFNNAIFNNGKNNKAYNKDIFDINDHRNYDLVYIDPPYYSRYSDNEYVRRYHFVEGLSAYWNHMKIQYSTQTKKVRRFETPFSRRSTIYRAFTQLFEKFKNSYLVISYSSNSLPTKEEMIKMIKANGKKVEFFEFDYKYCFANQSHKVNDNKNAAKEYLFITY